MPPAESPHWKIKALIIAALTVAVIAAYWPVEDNGFVRLDDYDYIVFNPIVNQGLTVEGAGWAFSTFHAANWHPLTWLSHMLDCTLFRQADGSQWTGGHHWMSVGFHAANSAILFLLLASMTAAIWRSAMVAALFALHPLHVESVAWIAERKDVLSTFFGLLAIGAYVGYVRRHGVMRYALILVCMTLSLLAKPMLVTLPCLLLLLDFWPLRRIGSEQTSWSRPNISRLLIEKAPLFALSIASSVVTYLAQRSGGAVVNHEQITLAQRLANAAVAYARYLSKTVWPSDLAVHYPHPVSWPAGTVLASVAVLLTITVVAMITWRRWPFLIVGWLWFVGLMVPVIGLVQVGGQSMADRYTYVPTIGLFIMIAWGVGALVRGKVAVPMALASSLLALGVLAWSTQVRVPVWRDSESLLRDSIAKTGEDLYIEYLLGLELRTRRDLQGALPYLEKYARHKHDQPQVQVQLGEVLAILGRFREAAKAYERALVLDPNLAEPSALNNYACILSSSTDDRMRNGPLAVQLAARACELSGSTNAIYLFTLAAAQAEIGQYDLAISTAERALNLARSNGQQALAENIQNKIAQFRQGQPSRDMVVD